MLCICRFEPCHLSCLGSSVEEHSRVLWGGFESHHPTYIRQLIFLWKKEFVSGVVVLCCIVLLCLLSRLIMCTCVLRVDIHVHVHVRTHNLHTCTCTCMADAHTHACTHKHTVRWCGEYPLHATLIDSYKEEYTFKGHQKHYIL